jgi:agmatine deiminase
MVAELAVSETVHINVNDAAMEHSARRRLEAARAAGDIRFHHFPTDDAWCRDHGAIILKRRGPGAAAALLATDWDYNAWGGKYPPFENDNRIPARMAEALGIPRAAGGMVLEGGSIDTNGAGRLLTTESCLLNPNRNPRLSRAQIETRLRDMLGVDEILWLGEGIVGDDTDGHIDDITRFVAENTVVTAIEDNPADDNHEPLAANLRRLESIRDRAGRRLEILTIPMPPPVVHEGQRLPASYANFYIANSVVLVPTYHHPHDAQACDVLARCFPTRRIVALDCTDLVWGLGAFHCLTQQVPAIDPAA